MKLLQVYVDNFHVNWPRALLCTESNVSARLYFRPPHVMIFFLIVSCSKCETCLQKYMFVCTVCSKTLWIGRLSKPTTEQQLTAELSQFGEVLSINVSYTYIQFSSNIMATNVSLQFAHYGTNRFQS